VDQQRSDVVGQRGAPKVQFLSVISVAVSSAQINLASYRRRDGIQLRGEGSVWIVSVRMLSAFAWEDTFGDVVLFGKFVVVIWSFECAASQTAFYAASFSGRLELVFGQPMADSCAKHARKFSTILSAVAWSIIVSGMVFLAYGFFFTDAFQRLVPDSGPETQRRVHQSDRNELNWHTSV